MTDTANPISEAVRALLRDIDRRDWPGLGVCVEPSAARARAMKDGLIASRPMKVGHRKLYLLTAQGRRAIGV